METTKYSRLPMNDHEEHHMVFDYTSAFSYDNSNDSLSKYESAFTYSRGHKKMVSERLPRRGEGGAVTASTLSSDKLARFLVTFAFTVIYIFTFPIMVWFSFKKIPLHHRAVVFRLGRLHTCKGPGMVFLFPLLDRSHAIDVSLRAFSVPPKQVITEDGAIIEVGAEIYFQIVDVEKSVIKVQNLDTSTRVLLQTALCNLLVQKTLAEIQAERRAIAESVMVKSNQTCKTWGVEITRTELSQIKVLSGPVAKASPQFVMPPGLMGQGEGMTSALMQMASAVMAKKGPEQTKCIAEAFTSIARGTMAPVENPDNGAKPCPGTQPSDVQDTSASSTTSVQHVEDKGDDLQQGDATAPAHAPSFESLTPEMLMQKIRDLLSEDLVARVGRTYQFEITGDRGGSFYLDLENGQGDIGEGISPLNQPAATLTLMYEDLQRMLCGQLKPFQAYMSGQLRVSGDMAAALKLEQLTSRMALV